jgi:hypothetical protein
MSIGGKYHLGNFTSVLAAAAAAEIKVIFPPSSYVLTV